MKVFIIYCLGFLCLISCNKHERTNIYVPQLYKDVGLFQKGSYWIYLNNKTLETDCTYVSTEPKSYFETGDLSSRQIISISYDSSLLFHCSLDPDECYFTSILEPYGLILIRSISDKVDTLEVGNQKYSNVYHSRQINFIGSDSVFFDVYCSPHVGIVKITKTIAGIDSSYNLLRWHVVQ